MRTSSLFLLLLVSPAFGQEAVKETLPTPGVTDEVIVRGQTPPALRLEIERAENAVYERFNAINSTDDFDIRCTFETATGTRMPQRVCAPVFLRNAQATAGKDVARELQGFGSAGSEQIHAGLASYRYLQIEDEMRRLAAEDQEFLAALRRWTELRQVSQQAARARRER